MNIGKSGVYPYINEEENFELGYSITFHKAQGSDFKHVLIVIPKRQVLVSKELLYTALTRSKETVTIFLEETEYNLLEKARSRSKIENVNSSIFESPDEWKKKLYPEPYVKFRSYQEYCIYKKLQERNIRFKYEEKLKLSKIPVPIKPDFTSI